MIKKALLFCCLLLWNCVAFAQLVIGKSFADSLRKRHMQAFGAIFHFQAYRYAEGSNRLISFGAPDNNLPQLFDRLNGARHTAAAAKGPSQKMVQTQIHPKTKIILGVKVNAGFDGRTMPGVQVFDNVYASYFIKDSSAATVIALGINPDNVQNYRYHVKLDDSVELIPPTIPKLEQQYGLKQPYAIIGQFKIPGKKALVEVYNIKNNGIKDGVVFDWRTNRSPVITKLEARAYNIVFSLNNTQRGYATKIDRHTGLPLDLKFPSKSIENMYFDFKNHDNITYMITVTRDSSGEKKRLWFTRFSADHLEIDMSRYETPGNYEIMIRPIYFEQSKPIHIPFTVLPPIARPKTFTVAEFAFYAFTGALVALAFYLFNRRKLLKAEQQKNMANLKLSSVRSQLNPHFMFNALTSIQNLMNQQDTEGANHYLSKFAALTRQILNTGGQELISLEDELQLLTDYLQMEQLRFGFSYTIHVDAGINRANTEIPAMLLQPFIENAARHGVSALQGTGKIEVSVIKQGNTLLLTVADNGPGFGNATNNNNSGYGLSLSNQRIALLNQVYKNQHLHLQISNHHPGAKITITLTDWL